LTVESHAHQSLDAIGPKQEPANFARACSAQRTELPLQTHTRFVPLCATRWFLVQKSKELFSAIQEAAALQEGQGTVHKQRFGTTEGLLITGIDLDSMQACVESLFMSPSPYFRVVRRTYSDRFIPKVQDLLSTDPKELVKSENVLIQVHQEECDIEIIAVTSNSDQDDCGTDPVFELLDFWVKREGYDQFQECGCCRDDRNPDQGVACRNNHFYCSVGSDGELPCFATAIKSQILQIHTREEGPVCPECQAQYDLQEISAHLPKSIWKQVLDAMESRKVNKEKEALSRQYNERFDAKFKELMNLHGDADGYFQAQAKELALEARNTVLNLSCPHCTTVYIEFEGCVALQCHDGCRQHFCGFCHKKCKTGRDAHKHVRRCLHNTTHDRSYYASSEQMVEAQKQYRTRELKKFLGKHPFNLRYAIVIELQPDLTDLGIDLEALL
jgi:hypothetical protein